MINKLRLDLQLFMEDDCLCICRRTVSRMRRLCLRGSFFFSPKVWQTLFSVIHHFLTSAPPSPPSCFPSHPSLPLHPHFSPVRPGTFYLMRVAGSMVECHPISLFFSLSIA